MSYILPSKCGSIYTSNVELNTVTGYDRYENMYYVISVNEVI